MVKVVDKRLGEFNTESSREIYVAITARAQITSCFARKMKLVPGLPHAFGQR